MCGFTGFLGYGSLNASQVKNVTKNMGSAIIHRGPDDSGIWLDVESQVAFSHQRLSVLDLSFHGSQPMASLSGRYVIVFNGEIYNHHNIRKKLHNYVFRGNSDTETILAGIEAWGLDKLLTQLEGMYAFAVWDKEGGLLTLVRDRIGEKPLYYGWQDGVFLFGSDLESFKRHPNFKSKVDRNSISLMLSYGYIPAPHSIYQGISKLLPGCSLSISMLNPEPNIESYWSAIDVAKSGVQTPFSGTAHDAVDKLESLLMNSVGSQMLSDVPLGAFLSGGIDSSLIVSLMQAQSNRPIQTFSIGFNDKNYNEAIYAKKVAQHLGTNHTELYVDYKDIVNVIPRLPLIYSEPFSDSSQVPTFLVSQLAKKHVTVALTGDAGDELFCGYNRYQITNKLWRKIKILPVPLRALIARALMSISPANWDKYTAHIPFFNAYNKIGDKLHKGARVLTSNSINELYMGLVSNFQNPGSIVINDGNVPTTLFDKKIILNEFDGVQQMMALDLISYLPDDILTKVDRAAMSVSLETRVPFLDKSVVEFAWSLPQSIKLKNGYTKWPLRELLSHYLPNEMIDRPKMGFGMPIDTWLRGPLRDWAEDLLSEDRLLREGYFHPLPIRKIWKEHLSGKYNHKNKLWNILMFQAWLCANQ
jgi:asparagine synthase (glutamine-hydrolysing)